MKYLTNDIVVVEDINGCKVMIPTKNLIAETVPLHNLGTNLKALNFLIKTVNAYEKELHRVAPSSMRGRVCALDTYDELRRI